MYNVTGKPIKGVIYDDVDKQEIREEMFERLDDLYKVENTLVESHPATKALIREGLDINEIKQYYHNMDSIAALTRYNFDTGITHNLIIPKESLSIGLVNELDKVDLGKDLLKQYADQYFEPSLENCCDREDEEVLETTVDDKLMEAIQNGKRVVFVADKDMTVDEFKESFKNFINEIERSASNKQRLYA